MTKFKGIAWIVLFLLLGVGISAGWEFDNVKEFTPNDKYGTIEIVNAYGLGSTLAEYTLLDNSDVCLTDCYAKGEATLYNEAALFDDLKFKDLLNQDRLINYKFYVEVNVTSIRNVVDQKAVCTLSKIAEVNGSFSKECTKQTYKDEQYTTKQMQEYNGELLPAGDYVWKIEGKKSKDESVDWIISNFGMDLDEWAVWQKPGCTNKRVISMNETNSSNLLEFDYNFTIDTSAWLNAGMYVIENVSGDYHEREWWNETTFASATTTFWTRINMSANAIGHDIEIYYNCGSDIESSARNVTHTYFYDFSESFADCNNDPHIHSNGNAVNGACTAGYFDKTSGGNYGLYPVFENYNFTNMNIQDYVLDVDFYRATGILYIGCRDQNPTWRENVYSLYGATGALVLRDYYGGASDLDTSATAIGTTTWYDGTMTCIGNSIDLSLLMGSAVSMGGDDSQWGSDGGRPWVSWDDSGRFDNYFVYQYLGLKQPVYSVGAEEVLSINVIANASILPQLPTTNTELNCSVNYTGAVGSAYVNFTWYKNDTSITTYDNQVSVPTNNTFYYTAQPVNETLNVGDTWICSVFGTDGTDTQLLNSTNVTVQNTAPLAPTLQFPANVSNSTIVPTSFKCNNSEHPDLHPTYYEFWGNYSSTDLVLRQNLTATTWNFTFDYNGTFYWKCKAHDNISSSNFTDTWQVYLTSAKVTSIEESHTDPTLSGTSDTYYLNLSFEPINVANVTAQFFINGTSQTVTTTVFASNKTLFNAVRVTPNYQSQVTLNLTWLINVNLVNGTTELRNYNYTQVVQRLSITNCLAGNSSAVMNFTLRDEINKTLQNGTFEAHFTVWGTDAAINSSLAVPTLSGSSFYLCLNPTNLTRTVNSQIDYNGIGYDRRDYFFRSVTLNSSTGANTTLETNLYLLTDTEAVATKFVVTNEVEEPLTDHYIYAQRKDISNATFFNVAMGKTDSVGEGYIPLDFFDAWYKFVVYDSSNNLIKITDETILQATPVLIKIKPSPISDVLTSYDNIDLALSFDNNTKIFTLTYSDPTSTGVTMCMDVNKLSYKAANQTVCSQCVTSVSGSISCGVGTDEGRYVAIVYAEHSPLKNLLVAYYEYVTEIGDKLGVDGVVYILLILLTVIFLFLTSPTLAIFASIVGVVFVSMLGFASLPYLAVISIVCAGVILLTVIRS